MIGASRGSYRQFAIALTEGGEARLGIALQWTRVWSSSEYKYSLLLNVAEAAPVFMRHWAKTQTFFESRKSSIIECNCMFLCLFVCSCLSFSLSFILSFFPCCLKWRKNIGIYSFKRKDLRASGTCYLIRSSNNITTYNETDVVIARVKVRELRCVTLIFIAQVVRWIDGYTVNTKRVTNS